MTELQFHQGLTYGILALSVVVFLFSLFVAAPYGRYGRPWWSGPDLPSRLAWFLMEIPQPAGFVLWFILGRRHADPVALVFLSLWMFHYAYRTFIYPFLPRSSSMALSVVAMGFVLNSGFSYLNGRWLFLLGPERDLSWLWDARFLFGVLLFFGGWTMATWSDAVLRRLRKPGEKGYKIPRAGLFRWVTSPNYLGEMTMWAGWALATWSLAGLTILCITAANLIPRALKNHRWYRDRFPDYPAERKALVPHIF